MDEELTSALKMLEQAAAIIAKHEGNGGLHYPDEEHLFEYDTEMVTPGKMLVNVYDRLLHKMSYYPK